MNAVTTSLFRHALTHGQVLWPAVAVDDLPQRHQTIAETDLVPVVPDLSTPDDVQQRWERVPAASRLVTKVARLCDHACPQGGLLSNCGSTSPSTMNRSG